ncbi:MAG TPA: family 10 glycosylhydrolase [Verrucomicrobiota bacterium]|nr:family 10 glycosylhydrolase [Verrucomicrobiota bacterium]HOH38849.1 family 10 glycosylhydrolase [Verrucomicrobiota bacterium]HPW91543.1 family 10 glycosylhydrolase [Verrucomicrobiota bacterium]
MIDELIFNRFSLLWAKLLRPAKISGRASHSLPPGWSANSWHSHFPRHGTRRGWVVLTLMGVLSASQPTSHAAANDTPPPPLREFRGAWVATVANIDWPSRKTLSTQEQKTELLAILDRAVHLKLNAIIFQVRPACDALYASRIEPWSEYLTGTMGKAPEPFYDPLAFAIEEAHKRGLELHAWFNPYRARLRSAASPVAANHVSKTRPQLVREYGEFLWLDPGEKAVQDYSLSVVMDVVKRYDVDGIHFDDYFYPYKARDRAGKELDFPDNASWQRSGVAGKMSRDDWRRENVNNFIQQVYKSIKTTKPWVKFGISPFGIWRPNSPAQIKGLDAYATLYADSRKWLINGWADYFAPQLYWAIEPPAQSFPVLLQWWAEQNPKGRTLCPGMNSTKVSGPSPSSSGWSPQEIVSQIRLTRKQAGVGGHIHWNMKSLMRNNALGEALVRETYQQPALMPLSPWLGRATPAKPQLTLASPQRAGSLTLSWALAGPGKAWLWLVQTRSGGTWSTQILPGGQSSHTWSGTTPEVVAVSAVNRNGEASAPSLFQSQSKTP